MQRKNSRKKKCSWFAILKNTQKNPQNFMDCVLPKGAKKPDNWCFKYIPPLFWREAQNKCAEEHRDGPHCTENSTALPGTATCRAKLPPPMQTSGQQHELQSAAEQWCWEQHTLILHRPNGDSQYSPFTQRLKGEPKKPHLVHDCTHMAMAQSWDRTQLHAASWLHVSWGF